MLIAIILFIISVASGLSANPAEIFTMPFQDSPARGITIGVSNGKNIIITGHDDGTLRAYDFNKKLLWKHKVHNKEILSIRNAGQYILSTSLDGTAAAFHLDNRVPIRFQGHGSWVFDADFISHVFTGRYVVTAGRDKHLRIFKLNDSSIEAVFSRPVHSSDINCIRAYTPDHSYYYASNTEKGFVKIITGSDDKTVKIWHWEDGKSPVISQTITGFKGVVYSVDMIQDKFFVVGTWANELILYNSQGRELKRFHGHTRGIMKVLFLDERRIISASQDKTIKVWDIKTGKCLQTFSGHKNIVYSVAFTLNKDRLISVSRDGTLKIWNMNNVLTRNDYNRMLMEAVLNGDIENVKKAVLNGADVNTDGRVMMEWRSQNNLSMFSRLSALALAEARNNITIIRFLKSKGARSYQVNE